MHRLWATVMVTAATAVGACGSPGATAPAPDGTLFALDRREDRVHVIDPAEGRTRVLRPRGLEKCGARMYVTGGRLVYIGYTRRASYAYALDPRRGGKPRRLGAAHEVIPSATPDRLWLAKFPRCRSWKRLPAVHEVTVDGAVTQRVHGGVPGIGLIAALDRGLLLHGPSGGLVAWDPESRRVLWRKRRAFALAAGGELVAWCHPHGCRAIRLTSLDGGRALTVPAPAGLSFRQAFRGALSPDGSLLAVPAADGKRVVRVALIDTAGGVVTVVPRSRLEDVPAFAWTPEGRLYWSAPKGRMMGHRPGSQRSPAVPVRLQPPVMGLTAGP